MVALIIKLPNRDQTKTHFRNMSNIYQNQFAPNASLQLYNSHVNNFTFCFITHPNPTKTVTGTWREEISTCSDMKQCCCINYPSGILACKVYTRIITNNDRITIRCNCCNVFIIFLFFAFSFKLFSSEFSALSRNVSWLVTIKTLYLFSGLWLSPWLVMVIITWRFSTFTSHPPLYNKCFYIIGNT